MAYSLYDTYPDQAPDVTCACGAVVSQYVPYRCANCDKSFEVACTPKPFWRWVKIISPAICPLCGSRSTEAVPCRLHRVCPACGKEEHITQGI